MTRNPRIEDVLGPLASAIVREVATRHEATVTDIVAALRGTQTRDHAYTTIMTVMSRLADRGVLARERRGRQFAYRTTAPERELIDELSGRAVDKLVDRYGSAALRHFAAHLSELDPETRARLESLADGSDD